MFGSKNDWKRHENSQHFQLELWKCGVIPPKASGLCGKLSFRRESHTTHLRNVHNITDRNEITIRTKAAHIGRNNFKTFWCGFCPAIPGQDSPRGRVVSLVKRGLDGWDERFDHLGNHFITDGLSIYDYEFHDDDDQYGQPQSSSDDEDDEATEELTQAPSAGIEDDLLGALSDDNGTVNGKEKVIECTVPDDQKDRLVKKKLKATKPQNVSRPEIFWYCVSDSILRYVLRANRKFCAV